MNKRICFSFRLIFSFIVIGASLPAYAGGGSAPARMLDSFNNAATKQQDDLANAAQERAQRESQERAQRQAQERVQREAQERAQKEATQAAEKSRRQALEETNKKAQQDAAIATQRENQRKAAELASQRAKDAQESARLARQQQETKRLQDQKQAEMRLAETKRQQIKQQEQKQLQDKKQLEARSQLRKVANNNSAPSKEVLGRLFDQLPPGKTREEVGAAMRKADEQAAIKKAQKQKSLNLNPKSPNNRILLYRQLAHQQQSQEAGKQIAGKGHKDTHRDAPRIANTHGGNASDWVKKTSSSRLGIDGKSTQTHWVENIKTGERKEFKQKITE